MLSTRGKTRITIYLDDEIIERFKALSEQTGKELNLDQRGFG